MPKAVARHTLFFNLPSDQLQAGSCLASDTLTTRPLPHCSVCWVYNTIPFTSISLPPFSGPFFVCGSVISEKKVGQFLMDFNRACCVVGVTADELAWFIFLIYAVIKLHCGT